MGKNKVQVAMETSRTTSEQVRTSAWTDNGRKINTLTPLLRKVLTGLSIGQLVIVAVTAATIGAFVNTNMKEIDMLKRRTVNLEETMHQLIKNQDGTVNLKQTSENQTELAEIEAKVSDVQTRYEIEFLELSRNLTEIKADQTSHKSTVIDLDTRLNELESVTANCTCNATMLRDHGEKILQIEANIVDIDDISQVLKNVIELQNKMSIHNETLLDHDNRLTQIFELQNNMSIHKETFLGHETRYAKITELQNEMSIQNATLLDHETRLSRMTELQHEMSIQNATLVDHEIRLTQLQLLIESNNTFYNSSFQEYGTKIAQLEADNMIISDGVQSLGTAIAQVELSRTEDKEKISTLNGTIQNIGDKLSVFDKQMRMNSDAIEVNFESLSQLGLDMNASMTILYNLESKVSTIEDEAVIYAQFRCDGDLTFEKGGKLVFSKESKIANAGNAFNPDMGVFESPVDGLYYFSVWLCFREHGHWTGFFIMQKDGDEELGILLARGQVGNIYEGHCSGTSAAAYLRKGSQVWTEYGSNSKGVLTLHTSRSFTAILLNTRMLEENNP